MKALTKYDEDAGAAMGIIYNAQKRSLQGCYIASVPASGGCEGQYCGEASAQPAAQREVQRE